MNSLIQLKKATPLFLVLLLFFGLSSAAQVLPPPPPSDGGYPGDNTAEGENALFSLTGGTFNTAVGLFSLRTNTEGNLNTGVGAGTILANTGLQNPAIGAGAVFRNTSGSGNVANGSLTVFNNVLGNGNTASSQSALFANTKDTVNRAMSKGALGAKETPTDPVVIPFDSSGYQFLVIPLGQPPPPGWEQVPCNQFVPGFNNTAGLAAFGSEGGCPEQPDVRTDWPINTELLVRREVHLTAGVTNTRVSVLIDNDVLGLFFNGTQIANDIITEGCPGEHPLVVDIPQDVPILAGCNVLAFHLRDRGKASFFDMSISTELPEQVDANVAKLLALENQPMLDLAVPEQVAGDPTFLNVRIRMSVEGGGAPPVLVYNARINANGKYIDVFSRNEFSLDTRKLGECLVHCGLLCAECCAAEYFVCLGGCEFLCYLF